MSSPLKIVSLLQPSLCKGRGTATAVEGLYLNHSDNARGAYRTLQAYIVPRRSISGCDSNISHAVGIYKSGCKKGRYALKRTCPLFTMKILHDTVCHHGFCNFLKTCDICTHYVVAFKAVTLCRAVNIVVNIDHNRFQFRVNFFA